MTVLIFSSPLTKAYNQQPHGNVTSPDSVPLTLFYHAFIVNLRTVHFAVYLSVGAVIKKMK